MNIKYDEFYCAIIFLQQVCLYCDFPDSETQTSQGHTLYTLIHPSPLTVFVYRSAAPHGGLYVPWIIWVSQ